MWQAQGPEFTAVVDAELALLSSAVRRDEARVAELLAEDFVEIGRSGRRWTRAEIVDLLREERARTTPTTSEWLVNQVADGLVLVTYRVHGTEHDSRHSSLWEVPGPRLRFHQGTVLPAE